MTIIRCKLSASSVNQRMVYTYAECKWSALRFTSWHHCWEDSSMLSLHPYFTSVHSCLSFTRPSAIWESKFKMTQAILDFKLGSPNKSQTGSYDAKLMYQIRWGNIYPFPSYHLEIKSSHKYTSSMTNIILKFIFLCTLFNLKCAHTHPIVNSTLTLSFSLSLFFLVPNPLLIPHHQ